jgi:Ca2+/H+ antiporter
MLTRTERLTIAAAIAGCIVAGVLTFTQAGAVIRFAVAAAALAVLATLVGQATERLGERLGPGATGVLQSALGNLPELFVSIFALRAGLVRSFKPRWSARSWATASLSWVSPSSSVGCAMARSASLRSRRG